MVFKVYKTKKKAHKPYRYQNLHVKRFIHEFTDVGIDRGLQKINMKKMEKKRMLLLFQTG